MQKFDSAKSAKPRRSPRSEDSYGTRSSSRTPTPELKKSSDSSSSSSHKGYYNDNRFLYVKSGLLSEEILEVTFRREIIPMIEKNAKREAREFLLENPELDSEKHSGFEVEERLKARSYHQRILDSGLPTEATFNVVSFTKKSGYDKYMGYGGVFVSNVEIANAIRGLNLDGSRRTKIVRKSADANEDMWSTSSKITNWADAVDDEYETIDLPPLVDLPFIPYSKHCLDSLKQSEYRNALQEDSLETGGVKMTATLISMKEVDDKIDSHSIWSRCDVPNHITKEKIAAKFYPYLTDRSVQDIDIGGTIVKAEVPYVVFKEIYDEKVDRNIRTVIVHFAKRDSTVPLILFMNRHFIIDGFELIFGHPPRSIFRRR